MTEKEFINASLNCEINSDLIKEIENYYGVKLTDDVKCYFSFIPDENYCGDWRVLSSKEILKPEVWSLQDFASNKVIPLIDIGDMEYISYIYTENKWAIVNDGDGSVFRERNNLADYLK